MEASDWESDFCLSKMKMIKFKIITTKALEVWYYLLVICEVSIV